MGIDARLEGESLVDTFLFDAFHPSPISVFMDEDAGLGGTTVASRCL